MPRRFLPLMTSESESLVSLTELPVADTFCSLQGIFPLPVILPFSADFETFSCVSLANAISGACPSACFPNWEALKGPASSPTSTILSRTYSSLCPESSVSKLSFCSKILISSASVLLGLSNFSESMESSTRLLSTGISSSLQGLKSSFASA